jgi:phosphatidate cytidylyltransferase
VSNTATRILFAAVAIPVVLLLAWLGGWYWFVFIAAVLVLAMMEFKTMIAAKGITLQGASMVAGGLLLASVFMNAKTGALLAALFHGGIPLPAMWHQFIITTLLLLVVVCAAELFRDIPEPLMNAAGTVFSALYFGLFLGSAIGIRELFCVADFPVMRIFHSAELTPAQFTTLDNWGAFTIMAVLATIWMCDTAAFFGGKAMGRHKFFPRVSPNKTWEGAVWGFLCAVATMVGAKYLALGYLTLPHAIVLGAIIGSIGQLGDLVESLFKRDTGVKDSSKMLPGHGGVYDRFDSLIFTAPVLYLYLDFVVFA